MSADGPIEIEFPSLTRSGQPTTPAESAPSPESNDSGDGDGDDFAWLAAAFADDDDDDLDDATLEDLELEEYEPGRLPSEEEFAELWVPPESEPDSMGASSTSEQRVGRSRPGTDRLPAAAVESESSPDSVGASAEDESERQLLGSIPALKTAIAGRGSESPPGDGAVEAHRPADAELDHGDHEAEEMIEPAALAEGTRTAGEPDRPELDADGGAPVDAALDLLEESLEDPDPAADEPDDSHPDTAVPDETEEAVEATNLPIEAIKRRPGFREELLAAFGQIYKR